jgi:hypothetical protein
MIIQARVQWPEGQGEWVSIHSESWLKKELVKMGCQNCKYEIREIEGGEERISIEERMCR